MKLDEIEKMASTNRKHLSTTGTGYPVVITKIDNKKTRNQVTMYVYQEPRNCNFKGTAYWAPAYFDDSKKLYLIYGNKQNGYKATHDSNKVGCITFVNEDFAKALNVYSSEKRVSFNWQWDHECNRPYIELV